MAHGVDLESKWLLAESKLLKVLSQMETKWSIVLKASHKCQLLRTDSHGCVADLDNALKETSELKPLVDECIILLRELKSLAESARALH